MKYAVFASLIVLAGCAKPVPVKMQFPTAPEILLQKCENLKQVETRPGGVPITDLFKTIIQNYTLYHECSTKVEGWQEWYNSMKKIYDEVGK
jgi:hypothetical protein